MNRPVQISSLAVVLCIALFQPSYAQDPGISSELERTASTSPQEKADYAAGANVEMRAAVKSITKLLDAARRDSDLEALQCLTNRLTSVRALAQVSESAELSMQDSLDAGEAEKAGHEFRKIAVALHKTRQLLAEAERCTDEGGPEGSDVTTDVISGDYDDTDSLLEEVELPPLIDPDPVSPFF